MADNNGSLTVRGLARRMIRVEKTLYDADGGLVRDIRGLRRRMDAVYVLAVATAFASTAALVTMVVTAFHTLHL